MNVVSKLMAVHRRSAVAHARLLARPYVVRRTQGGWLTEVFVGDPHYHNIIITKGSIPVHDVHNHRQTKLLITTTAAGVSCLHLMILYHTPLPWY